MSEWMGWRRIGEGRGSPPNVVDRGDGKVYGGAEYSSVGPEESGGMAEWKERGVCFF